MRLLLLALGGILSLTSSPLSTDISPVEPITVQPGMAANPPVPTVLPPAAVASEEVTPTPEITPEPVVVPTVVPIKYSPPQGQPYDWYIASNINQPWHLVNELVKRESGWNPNAVNKSSGACGLGQQLPCGKWAHQWNDPVGGLIDMNQYVLGRYGSWANAIAWHNAHNWY